MLSVNVQHLSVKCMPDQDGYLLNLSILNKVPCVCYSLDPRQSILRLLQQLPVDEVSLTLLGQESTHARFSTGPCVLSSGSNHLTLTCLVSVLLPSYSICADSLIGSSTWSLCP